MAWYGIAPGPTVVLLPVILATQICLTVGLALLLSMGNLFYRDVKHVFEVVLMLWMFLTSVIYPIPRTGQWGWLLALNPMTPIIDAYRQVLLEGQVPPAAPFGYALALSLVALLVGWRCFHEAQYLFAERV